MDEAGVRLPVGPHRNYLGMWRNWYTRTLQERVEQSLEVQILSCPLPGRSPIPKQSLVRDKYTGA